MAESETTESAVPESRNWLKDLLLGTEIVGYTARLTLLPILAYLGVFVWGLVSALLDPLGAAGYWAYFRNLIEDFSLHVRDSHFHCLGRSYYSNCPFRESDSQRN